MQTPDEYSEDEEEKKPEKKDIVDEIFGDEDEEAEKKKKKKKDELDEIYEKSLGNSEEDIYATEEFERYDDGVAD